MKPPGVKKKGKTTLRSSSMGVLNERGQHKVRQTSVSVEQLGGVGRVQPKPQPQQHHQQHNHHSQRQQQHHHHDQSSSPDQQKVHLKPSHAKPLARRAVPTYAPLLEGINEAGESSADVCGLAPSSVSSFSTREHTPNSQSSSGSHSNVNLSLGQLDEVFEQPDPDDFDDSALSFHVGSAPASLAVSPNNDHTSASTSNPASSRPSCTCESSARLCRVHSSSSASGTGSSIFKSLRRVLGISKKQKPARVNNESPN